MHKRGIIILLSLVVTMLIIMFATRGLRLEYGSKQFHAEQKQIFSGQLINVTGVLLMSPNAEALEAWKEEVEETRTLDFRLYGFSYQPLLELFQDMARAGVKIRGIVESKPFGGDPKAFDKLQKMFTGRTYIHIKSDEHLGTNFQHAKTFVTDDSVIIQTENLAYSSFFGNRGFFFVSHHPAIRNNIQSIFAKDREGSPLQPSDIHPNLLICPIDCRFKIETLLSGAQHSIRMYQQYIQDEHIMSMLMQRSGLDLRFIVADNDSKEELLASPLSVFAKVWKKPYVHAKMILIDDTYLIVSSINMSANSMDKNREIGIILIDSFLLQGFKEQFERDRKK